MITQRTRGILAAAAVVLALIAWGFWPRAELAGKGLLVQELKAKRTAIGFGTRRVRPEEFALFNQEFMALIRAGLTIPDALALAANRPDSPNLGRILMRVVRTKPRAGRTIRRPAH